MKTLVQVFFGRPGDTWFDAEMIKQPGFSLKSTPVGYDDDWRHEFLCDVPYSSTEIFETVQKIVSAKNDSLGYDFAVLSPTIRVIPLTELQSV